MKIGLLITSPIYVRNYINREFLNDPRANNLVLLAREHVKFTDDPGLVVLRYGTSRLQRLFSAIVFKVFLLKKLNSSKTFAFRLLRGGGWDTLMLAWGKFLSSLNENNLLRSAERAVYCFQRVSVSAGKLIAHFL